MALFKKKNEDPTGAAAETSVEEYRPDPENARKWFAHAKTSADSSNFGYALFCFASGIRLDPDTMS